MSKLEVYQEEIELNKYKDLKVTLKSDTNRSGVVSYSKNNILFVQLDSGSMIVADVNYFILEDV